MVPMPMAAEYGGSLFPYVPKPIDIPISIWVYNHRITIAFQPEA